MPEKIIRYGGISITYDPKTAFGNKALIDALNRIEKLKEAEQKIEECTECDYRGKVEVNCENCDGTGTVEEDCEHEDL